MVTLTHEQRALIAEGNASPELVVALAAFVHYLARARSAERGGSGSGPALHHARRKELEAAVARAEKRAERLARAIELSDEDVEDLVARRKSARAEADAARAELAALSAATLPAVAPPSNLDIERELDAIALNLGEALQDGYTRAEGGDAEAMRLLRAIVGASLRGPLRVAVEPDGRVVMRGTLHSGGAVEISAPSRGRTRR